ncbi:MAG: beta-ketoacyl synthase chain length factor [Psychromonas sp.]|nr:beta-ketoacyl synthase chain length factor [Psychromonas sp.]
MEHSAIRYSVKEWGALSPGLFEKSAWQIWLQNNKKWPAKCAPPASDLIPSMIRRRMSSLSKLAVQMSLVLCQNKAIDYIIFASRHGELTRTTKLLDDIMQGEDASPIAFSQAVHNTASGLFTMISQRAIPVCSLASGHDSLPCALIEASAYLADNIYDKVLIVDFDEPLPVFYQGYETQDYLGYAVGLIIESGDQYQLSWEKNKLDCRLELPIALEFLSLLLTKQKRLTIESDNKSWHWNKK